MARLSGSIIIASNVLIAVMVTERARSDDMEEKKEIT